MNNNENNMEKKKKKKTTAAAAAVNDNVPKADEWMDEWTRVCEMREL